MGDASQDTRPRRTSMDGLARAFGGMMRPASRERAKHRRRILKMKYSPADVVSQFMCSSTIVFI